MKKYYLLTLLVIISLPLVSYAQKRGISKQTLFLSPMLMPALQIKGFEDFDISDWQNYGLKSQDKSSPEGRVRVPMQGRVSSGPTYGIGLSYQLTINNSLSVNATMPFTFSKNITRLGFLPGIGYNFINKARLIYKDDALKIGVVPTIGFEIVSIGFGKIKQIEGYTSPVIIEQGTFDEGYKLQVNTLGFVYQLGLSLEYELTRKISFSGQVGYGGTLFGKLRVQVDEDKNPTNSSSGEESESISIKLKDAAIVKPDLSGTQANINPKIGSNGLYGKIGIGFIFGKK